MAANVTLWFKVTPELNARIEQAAEVLPGGKSALIRFAVERFVRQVESGIVVIEPAAEPRMKSLVDAPVEYETQ